MWSIELAELPKLLALPELWRDSVVGFKAPAAEPAALNTSAITALR
jgi:hypothetical protein